MIKIIDIYFYRRYDLESTNILECRQKEFCINKEYERYTTKLAHTKCLKGHQGILCGECLESYGKIWN